jgi:hypothetical protein
MFQLESKPQGSIIAQFATSDLNLPMVTKDTQWENDTWLSALNGKGE